MNTRRTSRPTSKNSFGSTDKANFGVSTKQRPLSWQDQEKLRDSLARYHELRNHPLLPFKEPHAPVVALLEEAWGKPSIPQYGDLTPADVLHAFRHVRQVLQRFAIQHMVLRRVREICQLYQQKWQAGGPLATLEAEILCQALETLVLRHLALREADGSISVHPAVRDYFRQLATVPERGFWHDLIGEQLISLVRRPGLRLPTDQASLDLVEEAIFHAIQAGQSEKALKLYTQVLGGHRHLAWKLGEMARGLRIMRSFNPCPDRWALGWYLRAMGELEEAFQQNNFPFFRADIRLLQGRLTDVGQEGDPARAIIAEFLMGKRNISLPDPLGCVIPRAQILLYLGRFADAWLASQPEQVYEMIGWEDDRARCMLFRAELASRMGDAQSARQSLEAAARWILHSGSVEHLCLYHLVQARIARHDGELQSARFAVNEGLHIARRCGLGLYLVELLCVDADLLLNRSELSSAEHTAREALRLASSAKSHFIWGAAEAGHLLGRSLLVQNRPEEARRILDKVLSRRQRIGDPRATLTQTLIQSINI
jgi:tetratricopeptide (TPR) repeat protein